MNNEHRNEVPVPASTAPQSIEVQIGEIVLHGFPDTDRRRVAAAVQNELVRVLAARTIPSVLTQSGERDRLNAGEFTIADGATNEAIGVLIARKVLGGLGI